MNYKLTIGWLYPDLMSTYGDRGNIICLDKRCSWRNIETKILRIDFDTSLKDLETCNLIIGGGAQDRQQELAIDDLLNNKGKTLKQMFEKDIPGLFVCGSPQLLGHYYMTGDGKKLPGLGIFDYVTKHFGHDKPRCIGNTTGEISSKFKNTIVGFENHGGRTYLAKNCLPFAKVLKGFGNNGEDGTEGAVYKNVIACYYHGPFLPKNPHIADWLIATSLAVKYGKDIQLEPLDDTLEWQAHNFMLKKLNIKYEKESNRT
ncbi:cobalamin biosynthesis protein CobQ [Candidatus Gottesmanbacteria bacterium RIFCSPHIGHO2_01_FULL_39_10]|uniref:Lipid II isoglutaminyl synthase (glutamine-hydrolyzing) subunit GatD n=1 Tax=Candidatus Gottesmanbacteria bacterium RIFCSPHIGHO2_01_FULL_39_10 TaxID=1798375 RepID=A0A1F5ZL06_9BACT|nr:MAG: cobalamin biosynthesis protein CobQ [Candidatus Gottesmanbacteria bacterium RIFCSPHIGHO2_01_FULL_39_10]